MLLMYIFHIFSFLYCLLYDTDKATIGVGVEVDLCFDVNSLVNPDAIIPNVTIDAFVSVDHGKNFTQAVTVNVPPINVKMSGGPTCITAFPEIRIPGKHNINDEYI